MMSILKVIELTHFMYDNGLPSVRLTEKQGIDPSVTQMFFKRAEFFVKIRIPTHGANDLVNSDILGARKTFGLYTG